MSRKAVWWVGILLILLLAGGSGIWWFIGQKQAPVTVSVTTVSPTSINQLVYATGNVVPTSRQEVRALNPGVVTKVNVKVNDRVKAGKVLGQFDTSVADAQVAQAQANLQAAQSTQEAAQSNLNSAQASLNQAQQAQTASVNQQASQASQASQGMAVPGGVGLPGGTSQQGHLSSSAYPSNPATASQTEQVAGQAGAQLAQAEQAVGQAKAQLAQAQGSVKQAQAALQLAQVQRDQLYFKANISGTVLEVNTQAGNPAPMQSPLVVIGDLKSLDVQAGLNEIDAAKVRIGQSVQVTSKALGDTVLQGTVKTVAPEAVTQASVQGNNAPSVPITVSLHKIPQSLKPGYTMNMEILVASKSGILAVPQEALFQEGNQIYVYRVQNGKIHKTEVKTGISDDVKQEITYGLKAGDKVVLNPSSDLTEGEAVQTEAGSGGA